MATCSQCGQKRGYSYSWWSTPREGGAYVCQPCGGRPKHSPVHSNQKPHDAMLPTFFTHTPSISAALKAHFRAHRTIDI